MRKTSFVVFGVIAVLLGVGATFLLWNEPAEQMIVPLETPTQEIISATSTPTTTVTIIGRSVENRPLEAYTFGTGETDLLFVGGIHGGYEWNSILLAYEMISYLRSNPSIVPENSTVHIIPNLNPDGLFAATGLEGVFAAAAITDNSMHTSGAGRMNARDVDLNRNFACKWAPKSTWRSKLVSAGSAAFSEPEAAALRDYVLRTTPEGVVFWHSQADNVYASECEDGVLPGTLTLMNTYALAGGYGAVPVFDAYPITGDAEGWLASIGIPAVTVELGSRTSIEWTQNLAGVEAVLQLYTK
jgi:predicted deacylase